jgi:hypothetical protein
MSRRLPSLFLLIVGVLLMLQSGIGLADAARAHVRCDVHGDMLHTDEAGTGGSRDEAPAWRAAVGSSLHHGCAVADAVLPTAVPLPSVPRLPELRWRIAPASANAPPCGTPGAMAPLLRAPKTSPPVA